MLQASRMKIERAKMQELFSCSAKIDDAVEHHRGELASEAVRSLSPDPRAFAMVIREAEDEGIAYTVDVSPQGP